MLIIRRKPGESILIGDEIELQVVDISQHRVKIGITAPDDVLILRKEIQLAQQQNLAAARGVGQAAIQAVVSRFLVRP
jgi:carbon storage regulator